jgi:menaquinone-9 beta-reductase
VSPIATDLFIAGAGPAGTSTALHLLHRAPGWADRMVVVDRATFPRDKLCGGGVTPGADDMLRKIGVAPPDVPSFDVRDFYVIFGQNAYAADDVRFRIVRRRDYDHALVREVEARGVPVRQGETVEAVVPRDDCVEITTDRAAYRARALVAADGSKSAVRRLLKWPGGSHVGRLLEILTPVGDERAPLFDPDVTAVDYSDVPAGLNGYSWDFPCVVDGRPHVNRGIYDSCMAPARRVDLRAALGARLHDRGLSLSDYPLQGHPIRWYDPSERYAMPRVLLAGDAAGVDPFLGEGISFAIAYGEIAADSVARAFEADDFRFADYADRIAPHPWLQFLVRRHANAHAVFHARRPERNLFRLFVGRKFS